MSFSYQSLHPGEIRLLEKVPGGHPRNLRFDLKHFRQQAAPSYTAMSYTWGHDEASKVIYLNGKRFYVRPNLWGCLYYLTQMDWQYFWADAICIDQENVQEKNVQVRMMDQVYANATLVSVWLGLVHNEFTDVYTSGLREPLTTVDVSTWDFAESLKDVANRPYWTRFWTIQEFLHARAIRIWCSGNAIDGVLLRDMLTDETGLDLLGQEVHKDPRVSEATRAYKAVPLVLGRHPDLYPELAEPLHDLLIRHKDCSCHDPRDRVFSLLSLVPELERGLLGRFFPDYNLTGDEVVVIALAHIIWFQRMNGESRSVDVLHALGVDDLERKTRLLKLAEQYDYIGDGRPDMLHVWQDDLVDQTTWLLRSEADIWGEFHQQRPSMWTKIARAVTPMFLLAGGGFFLYRYMRGV